MAFSLYTNTLYTLKGRNKYKAEIGDIYTFYLIFYISYFKLCVYTLNNLNFRFKITFS